MRLCNQVFWHQGEIGGHYHVKQTQGSEAIYQPEMRDVYGGTLRTTFDMCDYLPLGPSSNGKEIISSEQEPMCSLPPKSFTRRLMRDSVLESTFLLQIKFPSRTMDLFRSMLPGIHLVLERMLQGIWHVGQNTILWSGMN